MSSEQIFAIMLATIAQFIVGAIWYTPVFGKLWGKIHGFDKLDKKTQEKMMSQMGPIFGVQAVITLITSFVMVQLHQMMPEYSLYMIIFWIWLGFVAPAQIAANLFGGAREGWIMTKSAVMIAGSLVVLMVGAAVVQMML